MAKGEIIIDVNRCQGCGYCAHFCPQDCIEISEEQLTPRGYSLPLITNPDSCTACGICSWLCPAFAIDVYKYVKA